MALLLSLQIGYNLLRLFYRIFFLHLRVNRNYSTPMITAPALVGGLGLPLIEVHQMVEAVDLLVSLYSSPTPAKYLITDSLELLQLKSG